MTKKKDGFKGQASVVIPFSIREQLMSNPITSPLHLTDIGYYPDAQYHYVQRENGTAENILIYCISGGGQIGVGTKDYKIEANQFYVIPAYTPHYYQSNPNDPWTIYWLHFKGSNSCVFYNLFSNVKKIRSSPIDRISDRIQLFNEILENLLMGYSKENLEYVNLCIYQLLASFVYIDQYRNIKRIRKTDIVQESILFMKDNLSKKLTLEKLASNAQLSGSHFSKLFRQKTKQSPIDYLIQLKVQYACQLLDLTNKNITEICNELGYEDPFYFSRIFKKVMGISPLNYKRRQ